MRVQGEKDKIKGGDIETPCVCFPRGGEKVKKYAEFLAMQLQDETPFAMQTNFCVPVLPIL